MTWAIQTAGDVCTANAVAAQARPARAKYVLAASILASSLAFVDGSVVNVGLPAIGQDFGGSAEDLQWVINAYLLPLSALLLLGGAAGDRLGRRSVLIFGISLFGISSLLCAAAPSLAVLLAARALQGTGAALLMPSSLAVLGIAFSGEARGRAVGIWSAASSTTSAIGPLLGGWLIDAFGWRTIFLINLPLAAAAIWLTVRYIDEPPRQRQAPIDLAGATLSAAALGLLTWALTVGASRGWPPSAIAAFAGGTALLGLFLSNERRRGDAAMMPLALFRSLNFVGLSVLTLLLYGALGALLVLVPYVLIEGSGFSGAEAGAALLPLPAILAATAPAMGAVSGRISPHLPLTAGPVVVAAGFLLLLRFDPNTSYWTTMLPAVVVVSIGMAGAVAPLTTAVLASVDARHTGSASGLNSALARTGGLIATTLLGGVLGAHGTALFDAFHAAAIACAIASLAAGAAAFLMVRGTRL
jgi:EmrB/QacA subfamily drug resistance transporter